MLVMVKINNFFPVSRYLYFVGHFLKYTLSLADAHDVAALMIQLSIDHFFHLC